MKTLPLRRLGAKKAAPISAEDSSPLLRLAPPSPAVEPPEPSSPSSPPPDDPWPAPRQCDVPPMHRAAARRAVHAYGSRLQCSSHVQIWLIALDGNCNDIGRSCVARGGLSPVDLSLPDVLVRARSLLAEGFLLMQNHPGVIEPGVLLDAHPTITLALLGELMGLPLIEHIYVNALGSPVFMRERGVLKGVAELVVTLREGSEGIAVKAWEQSLCDDYDDKKKAGERGKEEEHSGVEVVHRRRRRRETGEA
jgi:RadC-like JAB domain